VLTPNWRSSFLVIPASLAALAALAALPSCGDSGPPGTNDDAGSPDTPDAMGKPSALCRPGPYWLTEGETVTIDVLCPPAGDDITGDAVTIAALPVGATYDPATARITWTTTLDQAAVHELTAEIPARGESAALTVGVADAWDHPDNVPIVDRTKYPLEYGLPVFFLSPPPEDPETYTDTTVVYRGQTHLAEGKKRGRTSLDYPKNSYTLEFARRAPFSDPERAGGFMNKHKIVLGSTFDDNSYLRQRLAFELWNRLDPAHVPVQSFMAVVYLDDEFWGLYTVMDHVDDELMLEHGMRGDGHLYKAIDHDANFRRERYDETLKDSLDEGYEKKSGDPEQGPGAFDPLVELVRFVIESDDDTFAAEIGTRIELADYMDWFILTTFLDGDDNAGKNSYHYLEAGQPWRMVPWDFNASTGQDWMTARTPATEVEDYEWANRIFERFLAIPALRAQLDARYRRALDSALTGPEIEAVIDEVVAEIGAVAARDQARWRETYESYETWSGRTDFTSYEQEVAYVRAWLAERWAVLDALYAGAP
jgi:spore coat protein H